MQVQFFLGSQEEQGGLLANAVDGTYTYHRVRPLSVDERFDLQPGFRDREAHVTLLFVAMYKPGQVTRRVCFCDTHCELCVCALFIWHVLMMPDLCTRALR